MGKMPLSGLLASQPCIVLDGGLATELEGHGAVVSASHQASAAGFAGRRISERDAMRPHSFVARRAGARLASAMSAVWILEARLEMAAGRIHSRRSIVC